MQRRIVLGAIVVSAALASFFVYSQLNKPLHALEVDATRDTTDISGILYRIRVMNVGTGELTGIVASLGPRDVQKKESLGPGESYFFYPEPETQEGKITVTTNEGIHIETDYRTPTKVLGLPGGGR